MQVGSTVWNGDKAGVVLASDESGVTVGYFAEVETLTSDSENPSPLSTNPAPENIPDATNAPVVANDGTEPPQPADHPAAASAPVVDLSALTEDERATFTRLQGKLDASGA